MAASNIEVPRVLPVEHLSHSSISTYLQCPEKWRRRYVEGERTPATPNMLIGSAVGAVEGYGFQKQIDEGRQLKLADIDDLYDLEWNYRETHDDVDWGTEPKIKGESKDAGARALRAYHTTLAPEVEPVAVERRFDLTLADAEWTVRGYIDVEDTKSRVIDLKVRGKRLSQADADHDLQATLYTAARRAEGQPAARFDFHVTTRTKSPTSEVVTTRRTGRQLDQSLRTVAAVARDIEYRMESGNWTGAPPLAWWCSATQCGFWDTCPYGGKR